MIAPRQLRGVVVSIHCEKVVGSSTSKGSGWQKDARALPEEEPSLLIIRCAFHPRLALSQRSQSYTPATLRRLIDGLDNFQSFQTVMSGDGGWLARADRLHQVREEAMAHHASVTGLRREFKIEVLASGLGVLAGVAAHEQALLDALE